MLSVSAGALTASGYRISVSQWRQGDAPSGAKQGATVIEAGKAIRISKKAGSTEITLQPPFAE